MFLACSCLIEETSKIHLLFGRCCTHDIVVVIRQNIIEALAKNSLSSTMAAGIISFPAVVGLTCIVVSFVFWHRGVFSFVECVITSANSVGSCTSVRDILFGMSFRISTYIRPMERWFLLSLVSPWDLCQDVMFCLSRYSRLSLQGSVFCTTIDGSWLGCAIISYCDGSSDFNSVLILNHCFPLHGFVFYHVFLVESYFCIFFFLTFSVFCLQRQILEKPSGISLKTPLNADSFSSTGWAMLVFFFIVVVLCIVKEVVWDIPTLLFVMFFTSYSFTNPHLYSYN